MYKRSLRELYRMVEITILFISVKVDIISSTLLRFIHENENSIVIMMSDAPSVFNKLQIGSCAFDLVELT